MTRRRIPTRTSSSCTDSARLALPGNARMTGAHTSPWHSRNRASGQGITPWSNLGLRRATQCFTKAHVEEGISQRGRRSRPFIFSVEVSVTRIYVFPEHTEYMHANCHPLRQRRGFSDLEKSEEASRLLSRKSVVVLCRKTPGLRRARRRRDRPQRSLNQHLAMRRASG
jgi:hypothetical protein